MGFFLKKNPVCTCKFVTKRGERCAETEGSEVAQKIHVPVLEKSVMQ